MILLDVFTLDNIIEPLINQYKDFNYVRYILSLEFYEGLKLYNKALERENDNRLWDLYLIERQLGYQNNFINYKKEVSPVNQSNSLTYNDKEKEEKRIFQKFDNLDNSKMKRVI